MAQEDESPIGSIKCDICGEPATHFVFKGCVVAGHPELAKEEPQKNYCEKHFPGDFQPKPPLWPPI